MTTISIASIVNNAAPSEDRVAEILADVEANGYRPIKVIVDGDGLHSIVDGQGELVAALWTVSADVEAEVYESRAKSHTPIQEWK